MQDRGSIEDIPLFKHLEPDERAELEEMMEPVYFDAGEIIYEEGGVEEHFFVLTTGTVEVYKQVLPGRAQLLARMPSPTVIGEMGLLTEPKAIATVAARTSVEGYGIERKAFLEMLDGDSIAACKVVHEIGKTLAERMAKTDGSVAEILVHLQNPDRGEIDPEVFQDRIMNDWYS